MIANPIIEDKNLEVITCNKHETNIIHGGFLGLPTVLDSSLFNGIFHEPSIFGLPIWLFGKPLANVQPLVHLSGWTCRKIPWHPAAPPYHHDQKDPSRPDPGAPRGHGDPAPTKAVGNGLRKRYGFHGDGDMVSPRKSSPDLVVNQHQGGFQLLTTATPRHISWFWRSKIERQFDSGYDADPWSIEPFQWQCPRNCCFLMKGNWPTNWESTDWAQEKQMFCLMKNPLFILICPWWSSQKPNFWVEVTPRFRQGQAPPKKAGGTLGPSWSIAYTLWLFNIDIVATV